MAFARTLVFRRWRRWPAVPRRQSHLQMLELLALLRSQELLDLGVARVDLLPHLRTHRAHEGVDASSVTIEDGLDLRLLLGCQMKLAIETIDDLLRAEPPATSLVPVKEKEMIPGHSHEEAGDECHDDEHRRGSSGTNRRH